MTASAKALDLKLTAPPLPLCVTIGRQFSVEVRALTSNVSECEVLMTFDEMIFDDLSGKPRKRQLGGGKLAEQISWQLRAKQPADKTELKIEGRANGLFQQILIPVEVTI